MKNKNILLGVLLLVSSYGYSQHIVGNDSDKHGCKASAGYTYSTLKKECIQVFNQEIQLTQTAPSGSSAWMAAVVLDASKKKAEIFAKELGGTSLILIRKGKAELWSKNGYELSKADSRYILKKDGKEIYKSK